MVFIKFVVGFTLLRLMIYWGSSFFAFSFLVSRNALVCVFICFFIVWIWVDRKNGSETILGGNNAFLQFLLGILS